MHPHFVRNGLVQVDSACSAQGMLAQQNLVWQLGLTVFGVRMEKCHKMLLDAPEL